MTQAKKFQQPSNRVIVRFYTDSIYSYITLMIQYHPGQDGMHSDSDVTTGLQKSHISEYSRKERNTSIIAYLAFNLNPNVTEYSFVYSHSLVKAF